MLSLRNIGVRTSRLGVLLPLVVLGVGCSRGRENAQVASDVQKRLRGDARMQMARVQVIATGGAVTLSGYVISPEQRVASAQDAAQIQGVRIVIDNLRVVDANPGAKPNANPNPNPQIPPAATQKPSPLVRHPASARPRKASSVAPPAAADRPPVSQIVDVKSGPATVTTPGSVQARPASSDARTDSKVSGASIGGSSVSVSPGNTSPIAVSQNGVSQAAVSQNGVSQVGVSQISASPVPTPARHMLPAATEQVTVPGGTELVVRLMESLSSDVNEKGDTFLASLSSPVMLGDRVVIPEQAGVEGKVVEVQSAGRFSGRPKLAVEMTRLTYNGKTYDLQSSQYSKQGAARDIRSVATIGGGAGVGAIIGAVLGGGRGAAIGSVIGAGTGTSAQAASKPAQIKLPAETVLSVRLQTPLTVTPASALQGTPGSQQDPFSSDDYRPVLKRRPGSPPPDDDSSSTTPHTDNK